VTQTSAAGRDNATRRATELLLFLGALLDRWLRRGGHLLTRLVGVIKTTGGSPALGPDGKRARGTGGFDYEKTVWGRMMAELLDYSGFYQLLGDLVAKKRTNTLLGKTDNNRSIIIGVSRGEIVSLICAGKRGRQAIPPIRQITALTFRLDDTVAPAGGPDLPPTSQIMAALMPSASGQDTGRPVAATSTKGASGQAPDGTRLCELLSGFLGPIAPVLCMETIDEAGGLDSEAKKREVILILAKEIDNEAEAKQFVEGARKILGVG
jgi:hypothetical protein